MSNLYWLSDAEWSRIEPLLPRGRRGAQRVDDHRVISGIIHMLRSGARWRDCPPEYGPYTTIYNRFNRWSRQGIWLSNSGTVVKLFLNLLFCPLPRTRLSPKSSPAVEPVRFIIVPFGFGLPRY